ncbi:MAG: hypothetical protein J5702_07435 [Bacteroidales bacterium]|nr:hypothetical protein [Bacteroidales bacterium]
MKHLFLLVLAGLIGFQPLQAQQQPVDVHLALETAGAGEEGIHGQLLNVTLNNYMLCTFLLDKPVDGAATLTLLQAASLHSRQLALPDSLPDGTPLDLHFRFRQGDSTCVVRMGSDSCRFEGVLLNQRNLVFTPLPGDGAGLRLVSMAVNQEKPARPTWPMMLLIAAILAADLVFFVLLHIRNSRRRKANPEEPVVIASHRYVTSERNTRGGIYLFGGFRVLTPEGEDITARFSPILRELLLLLVCHTPKGGITSELIKTTLWYDKDEKSAVNNRSVSLFKLRSLLREVGDFEIRSIQGRWVLEASDDLVDYYRFISLVKSGVLTRTQMEELLTLVEAGPLLGGFNELWADTLKADVTDSILSVLTRFALGLDLRSQADLVLDICDAIAKFDSLNETALALRCKAYREKGNSTLSRQVFASFQKEYQAVYDEPFTRDYSEIIST